MFLFNLSLWLIPVAVAIVARRYAPAHLWRTSGFALGLVISPATLGLYSLFFLGPIAAVLGIIGLVLHLIHGAPGYDLAVSLGLVPTHTVIEETLSVPIEALNALIWSVVYGAIGWVVDHRRAAKSQQALDNAIQ